jgi:hypothetical protein
MRQAIVLISIVAIAACASRDVAGPSAALDVEVWQGDLPISGPWLRERLPAGVITYQRIPNPLGLLAMPAGNMLDTALGSDANIRNLLAIQQGLSENLTDDLPFLADPRARLILDNLRSPIEIVAIGLPVPAALVGMTLDLRSNLAVEQLFAELAAYPPIPALLGPLDAGGFGQLVSDLPILVHFDAATGRLALYGGPAANRAGFEGLLNPAADAAPHPMSAFENEIDSSGQGYFGWVDTVQALAIGALMMPPELSQMLRASGADQMRALAFGAGIANGKGRVKVIADLGASSATRPLPVITNRISATSVGDPRGLFLLSLPSSEEFARLEELGLTLLPPEARSQWAAAKDALIEASGASIEQVLSALGPELITFSDQAGEYVGIKIRDRVLLDSVLARLAAHAGATLDERLVDGQRIHYVSLPSALGMARSALAGEPSGSPPMVSRLRSRLYWVADGDYLYVAALPQPLMDRQRLGANTSVATWLDATQRIDLSAALIGGTGSIANLPRKMYQFYIGTMQTIADVVDVDYDVWSMPTAAQLGLPERGALSFSLNLGEPLVSLELSYESSPADLLVGTGGMAVVAAAGVAAAVALPAYRDYTIRAQVSEGLNMAAAAKTAVAEAYLSSSRAPVSRPSAGMTANATDSQGRYVESIDVIDGEIIIRFRPDADGVIASQAVHLVPYLGSDRSGSGIVWVCGRATPPAGLEPLGGATPGGTTVPPQYLPSGCR